MFIIKVILVCGVILRDIIRRTMQDGFNALAIPFKMNEKTKTLEPPLNIM